MPLFFSFAQVREDLLKHTADLPNDRVWARIGNNSLGFQLKHIAGSVDRLVTYLEGKELSADQLAFLKREQEPDLNLKDLLRLVEDTVRAAEERVRAVDPAILLQPRTVGRRKLPTSVIGLLVHIAEHTQRHLGQAIVISTIIRQAA